MIYIFGDSHANNSMENFILPNVNLYMNAITMHRIGRDNIIINYDPNFNSKENIFIFFYGEVDCRCHIGRQILLGRNLEEVVDKLVSDYFKTISNNIKQYSKILIACITPTMNREWYESRYGPITHEFPFVGTNEERVKYTNLMNEVIKKYCEQYNYIFLDYSSYYSNEEGCLKTELSDGICHIRDNRYIIDLIMDKLCQNK